MRRHRHKFDREDHAICNGCGLGRSEYLEIAEAEVKELEAELKRATKPVKSPPPCPSCEALRKERDEWKRNAHVVEMAANAWRDDSVKLEARLIRCEEALKTAEHFMENVRQYGALRSEVDVPKLFIALNAVRAALAPGEG